MASLVAVSSLLCAVAMRSWTGSKQSTLDCFIDREWPVHAQFDSYLILLGGTLVSQQAPALVGLVSAARSGGWAFPGGSYRMKQVSNALSRRYKIGASLQHLCCFERNVCLDPQLYSC